MEHHQRAHGPGQAHVEPTQARHPIRLGGDDRGRLDQDDVVVLEAFRQRGGYDVQVGVELGLVIARLAADDGQDQVAQLFGNQLDQGVGDDQSDRALEHRDPVEPTTRLRARGEGKLATAPRTEVGGSRSTATCGSSRAAYSMTSPGTRKPRVSCSTWAAGLPR